MKEKVLSKDIISSSNGCDLVKFSTKKGNVAKEKNLSTISSPKMAIINLTNKNIDGKLSNHFYQHKCLVKTDMLSDSENWMLKNTDILCILYNNKSDLLKDKVKQLISKAKSNNIDIIPFNTKYKSVDKMALILNEISNLVCEPALINIDTKAIKGQDIVDAFAVTKKDIDVNFKKEYSKTINKYLNKIPNFDQIIISVSGGCDTSLNEIYEYVDIIRNKIENNVNIIFSDKDINIIFGVNIEQQYSGIHKIVVIFQGNDEEINKDETLECKHQQIYKNFKKSGHIPIKAVGEEVCDKEFYNAQIKKFSVLNEISTSLVQRYMRVGYSKAVQILDKWARNRYIKKNGRCWTVINANSIIDDLKEIFREKL